MAKQRTSITTNEPSWFGEVATYRHENAGRVSFETVSTANKEVHPTSDSERITRLGKVRVETKVTEWKGVADNGKVYQKDIETIQTNDSTNPSSVSYGMTQPVAGNNTAETSDGLTPLKVLKNFVDNIATDNRAQWICMIALGVIAATALILALV